MIISRTPLRMSFVGGGSDLPSFHRRFGGAVVSTAVNKFVYITLNEKFDHRVRVSYSRTEEADTVAEIQHPLVRESMTLLDIRGGIEITSVADIPSKGSGLGSSSAFTVGLLHALHAYSGRYASAEQLAKEACSIEIERCGEPIGKQDQYAAAFGGFNFIEFNADDSVSVEPILCKRETLLQLQENILVFYTGISRSASAILKSQQEAITESASKQNALQRMAQLARDLKQELQKNSLASFGEILREGWELKSSITPEISNAQIDAWHAAGIRAGAEGGKLLGAGSGGFLMFYAPREKHEAIVNALKDLRKIPMRFESQGSRIIFVHG
ncbi:MAG TPA: GHMP kinase [Candidatus Limnocylindria bacterium]|nr:GHMP kinase [Candidatus Limnocylindria bacterium]